MKLQLSQVHAAFAQAGTARPARTAGAGMRGPQGNAQATTATDVVAVQRPDDTASERIAELAEKTNEKLAQSGHHVQIGHHEPTGHFVVKVMDSADQIVRQFPSEDFLALSEQLGELRGLFFEAQG